MTPGFYDLSQAKKIQKKSISLKIKTLFVQDNFRCHLENLLSFAKQLVSSQLEISHVIQDPTETN